jgi:hypothetical protein
MEYTYMSPLLQSEFKQILAHLKQCNHTLTNKFYIPFNDVCQQNLVAHVCHFWLFFKQDCSEFVKILLLT